MRDFIGLWEGFWVDCLYVVFGEMLLSLYWGKVIGPYISMVYTTIPL